jgi:hypothetical protein
MKISSTCLVALLAAAFGAARASAEPGRYAALKDFAAALPEKNPNADPQYLDLAGANLPDQLASCRFAPDAMTSMDRLVKLFDKYLQPDGSGKDALLAAIKQLPDFADMDSDPALASQYHQLALGIRLAPDITRARIVAGNCRALLRFHFDNGASREQLRQAVEGARAALDSAPAPR